MHGVTVVMRGGPLNDPWRGGSGEKKKAKKTKTGAQDRSLKHELKTATVIWHICQRARVAVCEDS